MKFVVGWMDGSSYRKTVTVSQVKW